MNLQQANALVREADRLFERAASSWVHGNNSGNSLTLERANKACDAWRRRAEQLLAPLGIVTHYPGLYPSFTVGGFGYYTTESAVSAALEGKAAHEKPKLR